MNTKDKNLDILVTVMNRVMGLRMIKQVLCVILLIFCVDEKRIMAGLGISYNTVKKYSGLLANGKISELFDDNLYRPKSKMEDYREEIMAALDKKPARTLREAAVLIESVTGLKRSLPQVMKFLKKTDIDR